MNSHADTFELVKVSFIGSGGLLASLTLSQVSTIVSICVGVATFTYVCAKLYFLIKHKGKSPE
jgi:hypothetical protein